MDQDQQVRLAHFAISLDSIFNQRVSYSCCFRPAFCGSLQEYSRKSQASRGVSQLLPTHFSLGESLRRASLAPPRFRGRTRIVVDRNHVRKGHRAHRILTRKTHARSLGIAHSRTCQRPRERHRERLRKRTRQRHRPHPKSEGLRSPTGALHAP
jgi:hypothetical protein